jgi:CheY-like chemotaxis protein
LNAILGFAQLLQRDKREPLSDRHRERVNQIFDGGTQLLQLIDDVLDLSRIETGRVSMTIEPIGVVEVVTEVCATLQPLAVRHGIETRLEPVYGDVPTVAADRTRFAQILRNLGSNAIKYNRPSGQVVFAISRPRADVVRVAVHDTGIGIPAEKHDTLFQPFQRAGREMGPIEGTGIGLVITQRLARMMHGDIAFHSVAGKGSTFWIDMPAHPSLVAVSEARRPGAVLEGATPVTDKRRLVLYVEDNLANVRFMRDLVSSLENVELIAAPRADKGIALARKRTPDVIFMDLNLPGMSGVEALVCLRSYGETKHIPVIAVASAATPRDRQRAIESGFSHYLAKPIRVDEVMAALESLFRAPSSGSR